METGLEKAGALWEIKLDDIRMTVFRDGKLTSIPFQIDLRNSKGGYIFPNDKGAGRKTVSKNDELVFQGEDLGVKAPAKFKDALLNALEIKIEKDGRVGYAYIGRIKSPLSAVDYIDYDHGVVASAYSLAGAVNNPSYYDRLMLGGVDHLDRVKLRATAKMLFGQIEINRTEEDIYGKCSGIIDGPARVIRRVKYNVKLIGDIKSPYLTRITKSYKAVNIVPNSLRVPASLDFFFTELNALAAFDFDPKVKGAKIYCPCCKNGFLVDGEMGEDEFSDTGAGSRHFSICSEYGAATVTINTSKEVENLPVRTDGFYLDDQTKLDPPEDVPGMLGFFGYNLLDLHKTPKGVYNFDLIMLFPKSCEKARNIDAVRNEFLGKYKVEFSPVKR